MVWLSKGSHEESDEVCLLEAVSIAAGEAKSDKPRCVPRGLAAMGRVLNDCLDGEQRQLLSPLIKPMTKVMTTPIAEGERNHMVLNWMLNEYLPKVLFLGGVTQEVTVKGRLAPHRLTEVAGHLGSILESLKELVPAWLITPIPPGHHTLTNLKDVVMANTWGDDDEAIDDIGMDIAFISYRCCWLASQGEAFGAQLAETIKSLETSLVRLFYDMVNLKPCHSCQAPSLSLLCDKCSWEIELEKRAEHREEDLEWI